MTRSWVWAGARAAGTSHLAHGLPCQDSFACRHASLRDGTPVLVAALADGAGSAPCADLGSLMAVTCFTDAVCAALAEGAPIDARGDLVFYGFEEAILSLTSCAETEGRPVNDYASTLIAAVLTHDRALVGQIGDGASVVSGKSGDWHPVYWPDHGEYANTTSFVTQADAMDHLRLGSISHPVSRIALFSDGLERLVLDFKTRTAHAPFFESLFARLMTDTSKGHCTHASEDLARLLISDKVNSRTDDDKSILCAALAEA